MLRGMMRMLQLCIQGPPLLVVLSARCNNLSNMTIGTIVTSNTPNEGRLRDISNSRRLKCDAALSVKSLVERRLGRALCTDLGVGANVPHQQM